MTLNLTEKAGGKVLEIRVSGKLAKEDYHLFVPEFESLVGRYGKVRLLLEMVDFHGWDAASLWQDMKFTARHFNHIERLAMVGDRKWEKGMSIVCKPFTTATIKYFDRERIEEARAWLQGE